MRRSARRRPAGTTDPVSLLPPLPKTLTHELALAELDRIYDELPTIQCAGRCYHSCTVAAASELERRRIAASGATLGPRMTTRRVRALAQSDEWPRCPALDAENSCTAYPIRPLTCRAYGVTPMLRCPHGCEPDRQVPDAEVHRMMLRIEQLSRHVTRIRSWPTA